MTSTKKIKICLLLTTLLLKIVIAPMANAYDIVTNVDYESYMTWGNDNYGPTYYFRTPEGNKEATGTSVYVPKNGQGGYAFYYVKSGFRQNIVKGKIYTFSISFNFDNNAIISSYISSAEFNRYTGNNYFNLLGINKMSGRDYCANWTSSVIGQSAVTGNNQYTYSLTEQGHCSDANTVFEFVLEGNRDINNEIVEFGNQNGQAMISWYASPSANASAVLGTITVSPIRIWNKQTPTTVNDQQQQAGEQAQTDGQSGATSSEQSTQQGTQSLISALTGFVGAITNISPSNCTITGDLGALDMGTLNFCQDNPPAIITTISSLILIGITIPIVIWTVKKIISMFRSFTNG